MTIRDNKELYTKAVIRQKEMNRENFINEQTDNKMLRICILIVTLFPISLMIGLVKPEKLSSIVLFGNLVITVLWGIYVFFIYFPKHIDNKEKYHIKNVEFEDEELFSKTEKIAIEPLKKDEKIKDIERSHHIYAKLIDNNKKIMIYELHPLE